MTRTAVAVLSIASCARPTERPGPPPPLGAAQEMCGLGGDTSSVPEQLSVAVPDGGGVDPGHAPVPVNDAERVVFRQVYETLIRLDCTGTVRPGLAESWSGSDSGRRWTFTLRAAARFEDGLPVTARDVIDGWVARGVTVAGTFAASAEGDREVIARFSRAASSVPPVFADPALAVTRIVPGREWPVGTGWYAADTSGGRVTVAPIPGSRRPLLIVRPAGADARDLLDRGIDLLVTDDPAALAYAAGRPELTAVALPWDRTEVLLAGGTPIREPGETERASLAREAVRVEARPATGPYWWSDPGSCGLEPPPGAAPAPATTAPVAVVYDREDHAARDLAERLVALGGTLGARAQGVGGEEFGALLAAGGSAQFVLPLPRAPLDPCHELHALVARAPWLAGDAARIVPLIDTRRRVVHRRGAGAFAVDWDGTLRVR